MYIMFKTASSQPQLVETDDMYFAWSVNGDFRCRFTTNSGSQMDISADRIVRIFSKGDE